MKELQRAADGAGLEMEFLELRANAERYLKLRNSPIADVRIMGIGKRSGAGLDDATDAMPAP